MPIGGVSPNHSTPSHSILVLHRVKHLPGLLHLPAFDIQVQRRSRHEHAPCDPFLLCSPPHGLASHQIRDASARGQDPHGCEAVRAHATRERVPCNANGFLDAPRVHVRGDERGPRNGVGVGHFVEHPLSVVQKAAFCVEVEEGGEDVGVGVGGELERAAMELRAGGKRIG
uniref:Uncharacterized protein n=1 Tax=Arundo donax TaxID=35708 RepID=A0A0A9GM79_ARUDO